MINKTYVIIGTSAAGISAANKLRQLDDQAKIICISDEKEYPYNKCMLADYLSVIKQEQQIHTLTAEQAKQKNITCILNTRVTQLLPHAKQIVLHSGEHVTYDKLLIGVGTSPIIPPIEGIDLNGVFTFHRLSDLQAIISHIKRNVVKKVVIVGSGLSGLECADALMRFNIEISIVEMKERVLSTIVNLQGSSFIEQKMASHNISLYVNQRLEKLLGKELVTGVKLASGDLLQADMVIFAVGVRPNIGLAEQVGMKVTEQAILVDQYMQTSIPDIYAAGDIVAVPNQLTGQLVASRLWPDAMLQGLVAACNMVGQVRVYPGITPVISSSFFGIKFAACGPIIDPPINYQQIVHQQDDFYHLFLVDQEQLKGFLLVGNTSKLGQFRQLLMTKSTINNSLFFS